MEFMSELLATVKDRMKSKLMSSFIIAWLVYNYQIVLVIVGDGGFAEKLYFISNELKYNAFPVWFQNFIIPIGIALIYIWLVPVIEGFVYYWQMYCVGLKKKWMMKADDIPPVNKLEYITMRDDLSRTIKVKEGEIEASRDAHIQETEKLRIDVNQLTECLYRQIILRFIAESGLNRADYNILAGPEHGHKLKSAASEEFKKTPTFSGLRCFYEKTNRILGHHDTGERFIGKNVLSTALDQYIPSDEKDDFIYLLKAMRLISNGAGWAVNEYMLTSDDRMKAVNSFLAQLIAENDPAVT